MNRRGLLGMFAAGVGAAILPSGVIMPVRPPLAARPIWIGFDMATGAEPALVTWGDYPRLEITRDEWEAAMHRWNASRMNELIVQHLRGR